MALAEPGEGGSRIRVELERGGSVSVEYADDVRWLPCPPTGRWLPAEFVVTMMLPDVDCGITARVEVHDGAPRLAMVGALRTRVLEQYLSLPGAGRSEGASKPYRRQLQEVDLTTVLLRQISPPTVLRYAVAAALHPTPGGSYAWPALQVEDLDTIERAVGARTRGRQRLTPDLLREVAKVYAAAQRLREPAVPAVRRHFEPLPASTAHRWLKAARTTNDPSNVHPYLAPRAARSGPARTAKENS